MLIPSPCKPGDRVAVIAPSSPVKPEKLDGGLDFLRGLELEPVVYASCREHHGFLAGSDKLRADDIMRAFADDTISAVLCARGGYGAQRLLPLLDFDVIAHHPKPFFGYSDITALHTAINTRCGFVTYHAPMIGCEFHGECDDYTLSRFKRVLFGDKPDLSQPESAPASVITPGCCRGRLTGGNLSLIASSMGTPWQPDFDGAVLFLEDVDEKPHSIDRMLTQLRNAGAFEACAGIALGYFTDCGLNCYDNALTLDEIFEELLAPLGIPVIGGIACGHSTPTMTLPMGEPVQLDEGGLSCL